VVSWGYTFYGQITVPTGLSDISQIAAGGHSLAIAPAPAVALSRKNHSRAGDFDIDLPLTGTSGIECRTGGATNDHQLIVTYAGNVTVTGNPQAIVTSGAARLEAMARAMVGW